MMSSQTTRARGTTLQISSLSLLVNPILQQLISGSTLIPADQYFTILDSYTLLYIYTHTDTLQSIKQVIHEATCSKMVWEINWTPSRWIFPAFTVNETRPLTSHTWEMDDIRFPSLIGRRGIIFYLSEDLKNNNQYLIIQCYLNWIGVVWKYSMFPGCVCDVFSFEEEQGIQARGPWTHQMSQKSIQ